MSATRNVAASAVALLSGTALGLFGLLFGTVLAVLVLTVLAIGGVVEVTASLVLVVGLVTTQGIGCFCTALAYSRFRHRAGAALSRFVGRRSWLPTRPFDIPARVPTLRDLALVVGAYVAAFLCILVAGIVVSSTGVETASNTAAQTGMENPSLLVWLIPGSILLIGPGEEILFRGVVQGRFRERFGAPVAIVLASLVFAAIHFGALSGATGARLATISILLLPALVFGTVYELSGNIVVPALVHGCYNATLFGGLYWTTTSATLGLLAVA
ncbi:CPBP family intramembrane glutamic endopeptidase [Halobium palmae]|uniref:CPBP family intramembrane glutamic endopeptidase n=1 Tax=Halobium palmae TaxID=1776492 RepID=A0ABD5RXX1_9EURY